MYYDFASIEFAVTDYIFGKMPKIFIRLVYYTKYFVDKVPGNLFVMVEMHGEGASALGARPEIGGVAEHFLERHERMNALLGAGTDFCLQNLTPS